MQLSRYTSTALLCLVLVFCATGALAKSSKYDRKKTTDAPAIEATPVVDGESDSKKNPKATKPEDKKVDLSELENRYWAAKDTEFTVVQNRLYTKAKRFSVTPFMGPLLTDSYNTSYNLGVAGNYYFSEREGVEAHYWSTVGSESDLVSYFRGRYGTIPDYNLTRAYFGFAYNYVPIYAKLSWLGKKILYFDMSVSPGLGVTQLESISIAGATGTTAPSTKQMPITLALDIAQQLFLSEYLALRVDLRNHIFQEAVYGAATQSQVRTKVTYQGSITFGVTFFLGGGQTPVQAK